MILKMEKQEQNQIQKISRQMLVSNGCKVQSAQLLKCCLTKSKLEIAQIKKTLMIGSKPNFEMIFSEENSTSIVRIKNIIGVERLVTLFVIMIEDLVNYFNVQRPMGEGQIAELAIEMIEEMRDLTFEEIFVFIEGIKRQEYRKIYERFDAPTFWKMYWGEDGDDPNSYNFKKMNYCLSDATKNHNKDYIQEPSELEKLLTKPRQSRQAVEKFIEKAKNLPSQPKQE